jgi:hypothetical protein
MKKENERKKLFQNKINYGKLLNKQKENKRKMKNLPIKYNNFIPFPGYFAICLFGTIYIRNCYKNVVVSKTTINHEGTHLCQIEDFVPNPNNKR